MKKWIIFIGILIVYFTIGFYAFRVEKLGDNIIFGFVSILIFIFGAMFTNQFISKSYFKIPPPKRFKNKVNPIYKIKKDSEGWYSVSKFELQWNNEHDLANAIPFSKLFATFDYIFVGSYLFNIELEGITDIEKLWEEEDAINLAEKELKQRKTDKLEQLNKTFKENYE